MEQTKDGYDSKINEYYYLSNGEYVFLNDYAVTHDGRKVFLVTPIFEGEAIEISGDGDSHREILMTYKHKGEERLVGDIFKNPPLEKLSEIYRKKLLQIEGLSLTLSLLMVEEQALLTKHKKIKAAIERDRLSLNSMDKETTTANEELKDLSDKVKDMRANLSTLEDSTALFTNLSDSVLISKEEITSLNKDSFKLQCLEAGGVDNWSWYSESLTDFFERYPK